ncbi:hypothetical protein HK103_003366 [Boothiomyces macroporosus]|uniref:Helicase ATP-binding domain-containing protein n=1 Tax=Boothiomyces macroporosus TaxID=261099 RepID=A0AAD5Y969_9FUNG|nr:hypothetical protein HK103_003366 [Boothiomyces macroporosus]
MLSLISKTLLRLPGSLVNISFIHTVKKPWRPSKMVGKFKPIKPSIKPKPIKKIQKPRIPQLSKKKQIEIGLRKIRSGDENKLEIFKSILPLFNRIPDSLVNLVNEHPDLGIELVKYQLESKKLKNLDYINVVISAQDTLVFSEYVNYMVANNLSVAPSKYSKILLHILGSAKDEETSRLFLSELKRLAPVVEAANDKLKDYFVKWATLLALDSLESVLSERHSYIGHGSLAQNHKLYTMKISGDVRNNDILKLKSDTQDIIAMVEKKVFDTVHLKLFGNPSQLENWKVFNVQSLTAYQGCMEALEIFAKKGPECTKAYDILMSDHYVPKKEVMITIPPRVKAIMGVIDRPVSLIQGPPGTGKTFTLVRLIKNLVKKYGPGSVMVVAPTNAATDNIVQYCLDEGLSVARCGDNSSIRPDFIKYSLDYNVEDPYTNFGQALGFLRRKQVICSTVNSASSRMLSALNFKYVIIDEASQVTEPMALIPIVKNTQSIVLVGDHQQLPPTVNYWASLEGFSESLFSRLAKHVEPYLLDTQYRSHPLIMQISSELFYNGELKSGVKAADRQPPVGFPWPEDKKHGKLPVAFVNSHHKEDSNGEGVSKTNKEEANTTIKILKNLLKKELTQADIGVISPYAGQNRILKQMLQREKLDKIELNSVDGFQLSKGEEVSYKNRLEMFKSIVYLTAACLSAPTSYDYHSGGTSVEVDVQVSQGKDYGYEHESHHHKHHHSTENKGYNSNDYGHNSYGSSYGSEGYNNENVNVNVEVDINAGSNYHGYYESTVSATTVACMATATTTTDTTTVDTTTLAYVAIQTTVVDTTTTVETTTTDAAVIETTQGYFTPTMNSYFTPTVDAAIAITTTASYGSNIISAATTSTFSMAGILFLLVTTSI